MRQTLPNGPGGFKCVRNGARHTPGEPPSSERPTAPTPGPSPATARRGAFPRASWQRDLEDRRRAAIEAWERIHGEVAELYQRTVRQGREPRGPPAYEEGVYLDGLDSAIRRGDLEVVRGLGEEWRTLWIRSLHGEGAQPKEDGMKVGQFLGNFLRASDLRGPVSVVVDHVKLEVVGDDGQQKPIVYFQGCRKGLALNATNLRTLIDLLGSDETDTWRGRKVVLHVEDVQFRGQLTPAIRVRAAEEPKPLPPEEPDLGPTPF